MHSPQPGAFHCKDFPKGGENGELVCQSSQFQNTLTLNAQQDLAPQPPSLLFFKAKYVELLKNGYFLVPKTMSERNLMPLGQIPWHRTATIGGPWISPTFALFRFQFCFSQPSCIQKPQVGRFFIPSFIFHLSCSRLQLEGKSPCNQELKIAGLPLASQLWCNSK